MLTLALTGGIVDRYVLQKLAYRYRPQGQGHVEHSQRFTGSANGRCRFLRHDKLNIWQRGHR